MTKRAKTLTVAKYDNPSAFYAGGHYELNLSFEMLRDKQWQRALETLWSDVNVYGPLSSRYVPDKPLPEQIAVQAPPPTATMVQHGQVKIGEAVVGCDIQATRSLFECISVMIPVSMFDGLVGGQRIRQDHAEIQALDEVLYDLALHIYDEVPFKIAALGYERECQLPLELRSDPQLRHAFLVSGNFLAQDEVLNSLEPDLSRYEQVRANLRWLAPANLAG